MQPPNPGANRDATGFLNQLSCPLDENKFDSNNVALNTETIANFAAAISVEQIYLK